MYTSPREDSRGQYHPPSLASVLWRSKYLVATFAVLAAAAGYGLSLLQPVLYTAEGRLIVADPRTGGVFDESSAPVDPVRYVRNQAEIMQSSSVAARASEILGGVPTAVEIQEATEALPQEDLDVMLVLGTQSTAAEAVQLVNAVVAAYEEIVSARVQETADDRVSTLERSKAELQDRIAGLDTALQGDRDNAALEAERNAAIAELATINSRIEQITVNATLYGSGVQFYEPPRLPESPIQPRPLRNAVIAGGLGLLLGGIVAWRRADLQDKRMPAKVLDAPLLGTVPVYSAFGTVGPAPTVTAPDSVVAESYYFVVSSLGFALDAVDGKSVLITSSGKYDGKSVTSLNLALAAAGSGRNPLLIDADGRARSLTRLSGFGIANGMADIEAGSDVDPLTQKWLVEGETTIEFVPAGRRLTSDTARFFRSSEFRDILPQFRNAYDLVVVDGPPVLGASETVDIAAQVDGVVLVVRQGTARTEIEEARDRLSVAGTPLLGYITNWARTASARSAYGYE